MTFPSDPETTAYSSARDPFYHEVAKLPVLDAAYRLWKAKPRLDEREGSPLFRKLEPPPVSPTPENWHTLVVSTASRIKKERETAHEGVTRDRLLIALPGTSKGIATDAIKRVIKLEDAAQTALVSLGWDWKNASSALEIARDAYPGFSEEVYFSVGDDLAFAASK